LDKKKPMSKKKTAKKNTKEGKKSRYRKTFIFRVKKKKKRREVEAEEHCQTHPVGRTEELEGGKLLRHTHACKTVRTVERGGSVQDKRWGCWGAEYGEKRTEHRGSVDACKQVSSGCR